MVKILNFSHVLKRDNRDITLSWQENIWDEVARNHRLNDGQWFRRN